MGSTMFSSRPYSLGHAQGGDEPLVLVSWLHSGVLCVVVTTSGVLSAQVLAFTSCWIRHVACVLLPCSAFAVKGCAFCVLPAAGSVMLYVFCSCVLLLLSRVCPLCPFVLGTTSGSMHLSAGQQVQLAF